jgi:hypothetical protein
MVAVARRFGLWIVLGLVVGYGAYRFVSLEPREGARASTLTFELSLETGERLIGAAAGTLVNPDDDPLIIGTLRREEGGRVHVLHRQGNRYKEVWQSSQAYGTFDEATMRDVTSHGRPLLITTWRNGQHAHLDIRVFIWDGRTYRETWDLAQFIDGGQLTDNAELLIQRYDKRGNHQLVVRAPIPPPGERPLDPLPHQVSIYRWDDVKRSFSLFKRFVDLQKSWE